MRFTKPLAVAIGLSMMTSPVLAQSAAPLSLAPAGAGLQQPSDLHGDSYLLPAIVIFGIIAAAILISHNQHNDINNPHSP